MSDRLTELRAQADAKQKEADALLAKSEPAPDELLKAKGLIDDITAIGKLMDEHNANQKQQAELKASLSRTRDEMNQPNRTLGFEGKSADRFAAQAKGEAKSEVDKLAGKGGFTSLGHFAGAVRLKGRDGTGGGSAVDHLRRWEDTAPKLAVKAAEDYEELGFKAPQGMYEGSDPDGGTLVPQDFSREIWMRAKNQGQILSYLNVMPVTGNTMTIPALKEDSRADGSRYGGVRSYWTGEAEQYTKSSPSFRNVELKLKKLTVLTYVTEELLADSFVALESWLANVVPQEINFKVNDAVLNGTGAGMPLGIINSGSKITASAVSGQGATTLVAKNILAMWRRIPAGQRNSVVWLYNQDAEAELFGLFQPTGSTSGTLFFAPNTDANGNFKLMGRPAIPCEQCQTLGTEGDIIAFATDGYAAISKGGIESDMSIHLRFDYDERAYKWRFRFDGQPKDNVALTPFNGSTTTSSIVTLSSTRT
jgi:HK97 family phage major capsid protein